MKRINQFENLLLVLVGLGVLFYGVFHEVPELILQTYEGRYRGANIEFDPFWNYSFINLYKIVFALLTFLFTKIYLYRFPLEQKVKVRNTALYICSLVILIVPTIFFELEYNHAIKIALNFRSPITTSLAYERTDLNLFFGLFSLPLNIENIQSLTLIKTLQFITFCFVFTSLYFLLRHIFGLRQNRKTIGQFFRANQKDISYILIGLFPVGTFILLFNFFSLPIISFTVITQVIVILLLLSIGIIYNVFWFYPKYTSSNYKTKTLISLALHLYSGAVSTATLFITSGLNAPSLGLRVSLQYFMVAIGISLFLFIVSNTLSLPYYLIRRKAIARHAELMMKIQVQSSELSLLKSQINPHFLFNSLNTVYGLALEEESPKAAEGVQKLSEMMRFMLQENTADKIPLEREIKYIHDYIDFQRLRISEKENITLDIDINETCEGQIAPMLLIPMIENAFKHGISMNEASWISVGLTCTQNEVQLNVKNSMHPKTNRKSEESGIGLENVRKRLEILYPEKHLFQLFEDTNSFEANIKVTLS